MGGKDQENLTEFSGQHLQPYILNYMYVHVCTRSIDTYHISPYPILVREKVSHKQELKVLHSRRKS